MNIALFITIILFSTFAVIGVLSDRLKSWHIDAVTITGLLILIQLALRNLK